MRKSIWLRGGFWWFLSLEFLTNLLHVDVIKQNPTAHQIIVATVAALGIALARSDRLGRSKKPSVEPGDQTPRPTLSVVGIFALFLGLGAMLPACGRVVRDAHVSEQEGRYYESSSLRLADQLLAKAAAKARAGDLMSCEDFASDALVVKVRTPWHVAKGLANAGKGPDPGLPPEVPLAAAWCAAEKAKVSP